LVRGGNKRTLASPLTKGGLRGVQPVDLLAEISLADYPSYIACQDQVSQTYQNRTLWTRMSILNTARIGYFSSDRAIQDYSEIIWHTKPVKVALECSIQPGAGLKIQC
jgi:hypothetical protein